MKLHRWRLRRVSAEPSTTQSFTRIPLSEQRREQTDNQHRRLGHTPTTLIDLPIEVLEMIFEPYANDTLTRASLAFTHTRLREVIGGEPWARLNNTNRRRVRHYPHLDQDDDVTGIWYGIGPVRLEWLQLLQRDLPGYRFCHVCSILHPTPQPQETSSDQDIIIGPEKGNGEALLRIAQTDVLNAKMWHRNGRDSACATEPLLDHRQIFLDELYIVADSSAQIRGCELIWNGSFRFTFSSSSMDAYGVLLQYGFNLCEHHAWPGAGKRFSARRDSLDEFMHAWLQAPVFSRTLDCRPPHEPFHRDIEQIGSTFKCGICATELEVFTDMMVPPREEGQPPRDPELIVKFEMWKNLGPCSPRTGEDVKEFGALDVRGMQEKHFQPCEHTPSDVLARWPWET